MERDPARIDQVLAALREVWAEFPDMRLGQLMVNAVGPAEPCPEVFSAEDTILVRRLEVLAQRLRKAAAKFDPRSGEETRLAFQCCEDMRREAERTCEAHPDRFDCPDCLISYSPRCQTYGLIVHDGGSSVIRIQFCPWCGSRLPEGQEA
jgi:hypothetical protein